MGVAMLAMVFAAACTKVNEQPPLPPPPPEAPVKIRPPGGFRGSAPVATPGVPRQFRAPAAAGDAAVLPAARADTLNGDPNGPKAADMQKAVTTVMPTLQSCFSQAAGSAQVSVAFTAAPSGRAEDIRVTGGGAAVDGCLSRAMAAAKLPVFSGDGVPMQFPLSVERTVTRPAAPAAAAAAAQSPPPVFVNP